MTMGALKLKMMAQPTEIDRSSGVALWRQIADHLRQAVSDGMFADTGMLPGEMALAEKFSVNRHTIRAAIAALAEEGVVSASRGRGTTILKQKRLRVPVGRRTRFSSGLSDQTKTAALKVVGSQKIMASQASGVALAKNVTRRLRISVSGDIAFVARVLVDIVLSICLFV